MKTTLCLETSGPHCSVALAHGDALFKEERLLHRTHNEFLLEMIAQVLDQAKIQPRDLQLLGFGCGPGSFTGVRIAAAACQALALAASCVVVPMASSAILIRTAHRQMQMNDPAADADSLELWVSSIHSRGDAYYLSAWSGLEIQHADELMTESPVWLTDALGAERPVICCGQRPDWWPVASPVQVTEPIYPSALDMLQWVTEQDEQGNSVDAQFALPQYLSGDSPWRTTAQRAAGQS